ncbi:hypothetical protein OA528_01605 [Gammaproteobacteria bacterium]|nr:hypothetical protein [Gammaproteobacteria bacterium]
MAKVIFKTASADDPIYRERTTISSSFGGAYKRARDRYLREKEYQEGLKGKGDQLKNGDEKN